MVKPVSLILLVLLSCTQRDLAQDEPQKPVTEYESCCGVQPVEYTYNKKQIYLPNVFTPNGDGVNDYFMPYINDDVNAVWGFTILSAKGDSILYLMPYFDFSNEKNRANYAWNGRRKDGTRYKGLFKYRMRVDDKLANKDVIEGQACAILCGPDAKIFKSKDGCFYPEQAGEKGRKNPDKKNKETDCFN